MADSTDIIEFFMFVGQLKNTVRTGWVRAGVKKVESVSDHMYRMGVMTMLLNSQDGKIDKDRCMKLAVVHDLAECIVGDITPHCGISPEVKEKRERDAMINITKTLPAKMASEFMELWEEYGKRETTEALLVKDLDRFEMIVQAFEYEKAEDRPGEFEQFFESTKGKFTSDIVKGWVEELVKKRKAYIEEKSIK